MQSATHVWYLSESNNLLQVNAGNVRTAYGIHKCAAYMTEQGFAPAQVLFFAEFDLQFFKTRSEMLRHLAKCRLQHPPGDEIYRNRTAKGSVSMYEARPARALSVLCSARCTSARPARVCAAAADVRLCSNMMLSPRRSLIC